MWFAFNGRATRSFLALLCMMEFILFIDRVNLAAAAPGGAADITLIDDPLKAEEALSDARRQAACSACTKTIGRSCARAGTMGGGALSGDRRSGRGATRSTRSGNREPSPAERARPCIASAIRSTLSTIHRTVGEYNFGDQYQQAPAPLGGEMVKAEWVIGDRNAAQSR